jgi:hypothetical protein
MIMGADLIRHNSAGKATTCSTRYVVSIPFATVRFHKTYGTSCTRMFDTRPVDMLSASLMCIHGWQRSNTDSTASSPLPECTQPIVGRRVCRMSRRPPWNPTTTTHLVRPERGDGVTRGNRLCCLARRHLALAGFASRMALSHLLPGSA